jgi:hypothetical protein
MIGKEGDKDTHSRRAMVCRQRACVLVWSKAEFLNCVHNLVARGATHLSAVVEDA